MSEVAALLGLLVWGTIAGVDLVSFPQAMLGRPLVAATVTGLLLGDVELGLRVGILLECFALDVLPVGASRYPDYGPAAVSAVFAAQLLPAQEMIGGAVLLGLIVAVIGGKGMELQRRFNGRMANRAATAVGGGDPAMLARLQSLGMLADCARSILVTTIGLLLATLLVPVVAAIEAEETLALVAVAGALMAALSGALRRAATGVPRLLLTAGLAVGGVLAWLT
ncbi:MAG TPA: PTS sugar transporter subunit IIC [Gemmatimonadales bacterium]